VICQANQAGVACLAVQNLSLKLIKNMAHQSSYPGQNLSP
jgi:hypothetical protein